jgi:hypothetical protein
MRTQNVVHIGEHIANLLVSSPHRLVEPAVCLGEAPEFFLHSLELRFPVLGVCDAAAPGAEPCVGQVQRVDSSQKGLFFANRSLVGSSVMQWGDRRYLSLRTTITWMISGRWPWIA